MELIGSKIELIEKLLEIPDGDYHLVIVKLRNDSVSQIHTLLKKTKPNGMVFEDWKNTIKERHGLVTEEGVRSFKHLTKNERETLIHDLCGTLEEQKQSTK